MKAKQIFIPAVLLVVICVIVTGLLAVTNELTKDKIAEMNAAAADEARIAVLGDTKYDDTQTKQIADNPYDVYVYYNAGHPVAYVFTETVKGYGGDLTVMIGVSFEGAVTGVEITECNETVGLGANTQKPAFRDQYVKGEAVDEYVVGQNIDAVTGATISSKAVTKAVNAALEQYRIIRNGGED